MGEYSFETFQENPFMATHLSQHPGCFLTVPPKKHCPVIHVCPPVPPPLVSLRAMSTSS